jgi:hypothetical protein
MIKQPVRNFFLVLGLTALSAVNAFSQGKSIQIEAASQISTADFNPQIVVNPAYTEREANPNESTNMQIGPSNKLKAGSVMTVARGSVGPKFKGIGFTGYVPPDCDMAVGPNQVVAVVNTEVAFFDKATGTKTFQQTMDNTGFFSGIASGNVYSDPKAFYDKSSGRFFIGILEIDFSSNISKFLLAVSDDNNPAGTWNRYRIECKATQSGNDFWMDYPGFGFSKDAIMISGNMFPFAGGGVFNEIVTVPKAPLLTGAAATGTSVIENSFITIQPARTADASQTVQYAAAALNSTTIRLFAISNPAGSPTIVRKDIAVPSFQFPEKVPTGGGRFLDGLDGRLYNCHFRGGKIVASHTTKVANGQMKVRWYEFNVGTWPASGSPTLKQSGDIQVASNSTHMPAINTNSAGDISVVYSRSGPSLNPEVCQSSRLATDPNGQIGAPVVLHTSAGTYGGAGTNRWGDYFALEIDPNDNLTFWGHGMYGVAGGAWESGIFKYSISAGSAGTLVDPVSSSVYQGSAISGDNSSITTSDNSRFTVQSILIDKFGEAVVPPAQATAQAAAIQADFDLDLSQGTLSDLKVSIEANTSITGPAGQVFAWNWSTGAFVSIGSFALGVGDKTGTVSIPRASLSSYVDGTGNVRLLIRAINSVKGGRPGVIPPQFNFGIDRLGLAAAFT